MKYMFEIGKILKCMPPNRYWDVHEIRPSRLSIFVVQKTHMLVALLGTEKQAIDRWILFINLPLTTKIHPLVK